MSEDLSAPFMDRRQQLANASLDSEYNAIGGPAPAPPKPSPEDQVSDLSLSELITGKPKQNIAVRAGKDIALGAVETPRAIFTGVRDAYQNTVDMAREFGGWLEEKGAGG